MADKMAAKLPPSEREKFKQMLTSQLDIQALTRAMTDAMIKHFTTEELKALADLMPTMQAEIMKAQAKANQSLPNQSPR
jgi:hypothetical protein